MNTVEREARVLRYLRNHPESTAHAILKATRCDIALVNERFITFKDVPRSGRRLYSVNQLKYRRYLRQGNYE